LKKLPRLNFILAQVSLFYTILRKGGLRDVEVIRAEDPRLNGLYGYFFSKLLQKPLIVGVWGNPGRLREMNQSPNMPRLFPSMRIEEMVEKFVLRRATFVLAQNLENMSYATSAGVPIEKQMLTELGVGIDESHFLPFDLRMDVSLEIGNWNLDGKFVLICISRLEKLKMVDHAILSTICLKKSSIDFVLVIVGDGSEMLNLKNLAVEHNLEESIIFTGNRSQAWISGFLKHVDLNVAPLCGRSLLEASLAGCPAVAYDLDWHSIIVQNSLTGYLVPPLDHNLLGQRLLEAYENPALRSTMRLAMKELATEFANRDGIRQKQKNLYESISKK
jgi:glycosyltransferase involved in cell wall biosynthesis